MTRDVRFVSRQEVQTALDVDEEFLLALEQEEIVACERQGDYAPATVERIRICYTLHEELGVNFAGLEVALRLLDTIQDERRQFQDVLSWLKSQLEDQSKNG